MKLFLVICFIFFFKLVVNETTTDPLFQSFDVQTLTNTKLQNSNITKVLLPLIERSDITLLQGIEDTVDITNLKAQINKASSTTYEAIVGKKSSTSSNYDAFYYKKDVYTVVKTLNFTNAATIFDQEPLIVEFQHIESGTKFTIVGVHTINDVTKSQNEISQLWNVYQEFKNDTEILVFMGNFRAGCTYINSATFSNLEFRSSSELTWFIGDSTTTYLKGTCAFDRIVSNAGFRHISASSGVYDYITAYSVDSTTRALISDHYPVQVTVKFPPKDSVQFYVELAIIGGSLLVFLSIVLIGSVALIIVFTIIEKKKAASTTNTE
eukprot:gene9770-2097_t